MSSQFDEGKVKRATDGKFAEKPHDAAASDVVGSGLEDWSPVDVDVKLAELWVGQVRCEREADMNLRYSREYPNEDRWRRGYEKQVALLKELRAEAEPYEEEYRRRPWERVFIVPGGHVHNGRACGTCYPTTQYAWLTQYSGADHSAIVEDAGERACSVCYPDAPVTPSRMYAPDETTDAEKQERAAELVKKKAAAAEKAIFAPDGSPLRDRHHGSYKTERSAVIAATDSAVDAASLLFDADETDEPSYASHWRKLAGEYREHFDSVAEAVAAKHSRDVSDVRAELQDRAAAKAKREGRDEGVYQYLRW